MSVVWSPCFQRALYPAVAAQSELIRPKHNQHRLYGIKSKVMFKITGNLKDPGGITIQHCYSLPQNLLPFVAYSGPQKVKSVAFCGGTFCNC